MNNLDTQQPTSPPSQGSSTAAKKPARPVSRSRRVLSWVVKLAVVLIILEVGCWLVGRTMDVRRTTDIFEEQSALIHRVLEPSATRLEELHPVLGWRYAANHKSDMHQLNSLAVRSDREYTPAPVPGVLRIAAFGDSVVYCSEVDNANSWPTLMEKKNPDFEVLNFGVPGYGLDQAYIRYRVDGRAVHPHVVLIGFAPDDIWRVSAYYWRFKGDRAFPFFKPRFLLDDQGNLTQLNIPVPERADYERLAANPREVLRYGEHDYYYRASVYENPLYDYSATVRLGTLLGHRIHERYLDPERPYRGQGFNEDAAMFKLNLAIFEKFVAEVQAAGSLPLVVLLPDKESLQRTFNGGPALYDPMAARLKEKGIVYLDIKDAFHQAGDGAQVPSWYAPQGHYSAAGNQVVSAWLTAQVRKQVESHRQGRKDSP